ECRPQPVEIAVRVLDRKLHRVELLARSLIARFHDVEPPVARGPRPAPEGAILYPARRSPAQRNGNPGLTPPRLPWSRGNHGPRRSGGDLAPGLPPVRHAAPGRDDADGSRPVRPGDAAAESQHRLPAARLLDRPALPGDLPPARPAREPARVRPRPR